jgi:lysophospholipase L1-like esterase
VKSFTHALLALLVFSVVAGCGFAVGALADRYFVWPVTLFRKVPVASSRTSIPPRTFDYLAGTADVVMLGDSITEAGRWDELFPTVKIINRGAGGDSTVEIIGRLEEVIRRRPKLVCLMAGINDLQRGEPASVVCARYGAIIRTLRAGGIGVVVQSTLHVRVDHGAAPSINRRVDLLNMGLRRLCTETGAHYLDIDAVLAPGGNLDPKFSSDAVHLSGAAYVAWSQQLGQCMARIDGFYMRK